MFASSGLLPPGGTPSIEGDMSGKNGFGMLYGLLSSFDMSSPESDGMALVLVLPPAGVEDVAAVMSNDASGMSSTFSSPLAISSGCLVARCDSIADLARNSARQKGHRLWMSCWWTRYWPLRSRARVFWNHTCTTRFFRPTSCAIDSSCLRLGLQSSWYLR
ncbi:hypothetical protein NP493_11g11040 [Ridgeia piscesae]|uniref:Uncharacterized protein n=1 Tax=Ridgeia piscesae TaxID=27915 RepID=A0AAD9PF96_RIDPI|nr:hypothetical protein NP493_11g11040 [Ridgeia piscesae]